MEYENYPVIEARLGANIEPTQSTVSDPFSASWDDIKSSIVLDTNFKRRVDRLQKSVTPKYVEDSMMNPDGTGVGSKQINVGEDGFVNGYGAFDVVTPPYNLYTLSGFYDTSFSNHAAIDAKVMGSVGVGYGFDLTRKAMQTIQTKPKTKQDKDAKKIDAIKVQVIDWLESLNTHDSFTDTMRKVVTDFEATGNGYIEVGRTVTGQIGYVGHVPSTTLRVRRLKDGYVQIIGQRAVYFRNYGATNSPPFGTDPSPNEIIHLKKYSPLNTFYGVSDIVSAATSVVGDQQAEQYNLEFFENKAVPRYIITLKGAKLSPTAEDKLFRFLQTNLKGQNHRTLYIPLPPDEAGNKVDFKMEPVENEVQDSSFEKYRQSNRQNILLAHQVPLSKLGIAEGSGVAAAVTQDRTFRDNVLRPLQRYLEKQIAGIIREVTEMIEIRFNEASVVDENVASQIHERYLVNNVLKPNEVREAIGKAQIEGLDDEKKKAEEAALQAKQAEPAANQDGGNDARDRQRATDNSDSPTTATGRNPKGSGAKEDTAKK